MTVSMRFLAVLGLCALLPRIAGAFEATDSYLRGDVEGWQVRYSAAYRDHPTEFARMRGYVRGQLDLVVDVLPEEAADTLRQVAIWVEFSPDGEDGGAYHPSREWLEENGMNPAKAQGIELGYSDFLDRNMQPAILLHELAHAYEDTVLDYPPAIGEAHARALGMEGYRRARHVDGFTGRAYALSDASEYFAELTEAYFVRNDFAPFDRAELKALDPAGYAMIEVLWGVRP